MSALPADLDSSISFGSGLAVARLLALAGREVVLLEAEEAELETKRPSQDEMAVV